jgi:hypothetical protein
MFRNKIIRFIILLGKYLWYKCYSADMPQDFSTELQLFKLDKKYRNLRKYRSVINPLQKKEKQGFPRLSYLLSLRAGAFYQRKKKSCPKIHSFNKIKQSIMQRFLVPRTFSEAGN